ncbi:MAG: hypothetical protein QG604_569 [Candidatus Dependentiae bacterium]|nr:hypothetical protein [Candidatus Dependentiae bacterium]
MASAIKKVTTAILHGLSMGSNILGVRQISRGPDNIMNFYVVYSQGHLRWAEMIRQQLASSLESAMPQLKFYITTTTLPYGSKEQVINTLFSHDILSGSVKEPGHTFIITPGWWESQMIEYARSIGVLGLPQLFCLPTSPAELFHQAGQSSCDRSSLGGVYSWPADPQSYVDNLMAVKDGVKKVLVPYNITDGTDHMIQVMKYQMAELKKAFYANGIEVIAHRWTFDSMESFRLRTTLKSCDAVITLHEPTAELYSAELTALCKKVHKPHYASQLDSVYEGAAIGSGVFGGAFGPPLVSLVAQFLATPERGLGWQTVCIPPQSGAHINDNEREEQGIFFDKKQEALFRAKSIFGTHQTEY